MPGNSLAVTQTGLEAVDTAMQAVSDNLANAQTTGYQAESVEFATLLGEFIGGSALGGGVTATGISRDFSQGAIVQANSPTDMAIQGDGFFVLQDASGNVTYTRNGQFATNNAGVLQAANGADVEGYAINAAGNPSGVLGSIVIPQGVLAPAASTQNTISGNLDSTQPTIAGAINPADPTTWTTSQSVQVFDSLGNAHVLTYYYQNSAAGAGPTETWNWTATLDGSAVGLANNSGTLTFNASGALIAGGNPPALTATLANANPLSINLNFNALTQFAGASTTTGVADGNAIGTPQSVQVNNNGLVSVSYSNGNTVNIAQVAVATFANNQGLQLDNAGTYTSSLASGPATVSTAGAGAAGTIQASSLEDSNADTTGSLVALVVLQQSFQANSKALQTEDDILGTLMQLQTT